LAPIVIPIVIPQRGRDRKNTGKDRKRYEREERYLPLISIIF
jgi:hypothetical protein